MLIWKTLISYKKSEKMKRKIVTFLMSLLFMLPVMADTMPYYMHNIPASAIGVFQTGKTLTIYSEADETSHVVKEFNFSYNPETMPDGVFAVLLNEKKLGLMYVTDIGDDGWVQVIYDKQRNAKGWVLTEDKFQFLPWISFYNMYGRKYGLRVLKDSPDEIDILRAKADDLAQSVAKMRYVKQIRMTAIRGNWALVSVVDIDKAPKTGFMKWRDTNGKIYAFPNIK